jgi:hypothetical protein
LHLHSDLNSPHKGFWAGTAPKGNLEHCSRTQSNPSARLRPSPASCPANEGGDIVLPAGSAARPATLICNYTITASTSEPGVLSGVVQTADEAGGRAGAPPRAAAAAKARATAAADAVAAGPLSVAVAPRAFNFTGKGVARRARGECAALSSSFVGSGGNGTNVTARARAAADASDAGGGAAAALARAGAAAGLGSTPLVLTPNATGGGAPQGPKGAVPRLCDAENTVEFSAAFSGFGNRSCNRYLVGLGGAAAAAAAAGVAASRADGHPQPSGVAGLRDLLGPSLRGCPLRPP